eukprot:439557-Pelagomonas_calceolata.AAC.1
MATSLLPLGVLLKTTLLFTARRNLSGIKVGRSAWERTKTATGQLLCRAEELVPLGKTQSGMAWEMYSLNGLQCLVPRVSHFGRHPCR